MFIALGSTLASVLLHWFAAMVLLTLVIGKQGNK